MLNTINLLYTTSINFAQDVSQTLGAYQSKAKKPSHKGETAPETGDNTLDKQTYCLAYNYARELLLDGEEVLVKNVLSSDGGAIVKYGFGLFSWKTLEYEYPLDEGDINPYVVKQNKGEMLPKEESFL